MTQPSALFADFAPRTPLSNPLRAAITAAYRRPEPEALAPLLAQARLPADQAASAAQLALRIAKALRERKASAGRAGIVQGLLQEFSLSSQEGVALMCLAEALLRIPDKATASASLRLAMRPSSCRIDRILRSMRSRSGSACMFIRDLFFPAYYFRTFIHQQPKDHRQ